jgi:hypothetical protein
VDLSPKIKCRCHLPESGGLGKPPDRQINLFLAMPPKVLLRAAFAESGFRKIWFSKNLDTKILTTKNLGRHDGFSLDRHCLDHDYAI